MNPSKLRSINLDTLFRILKKLDTEPYQHSVLMLLVTWNISIKRLVDEDELFMEANTRAQSSLDLLLKSKDEHAAILVARWCHDYRSIQYDVVADVIRYQNMLVGDVVGALKGC